MNICTGDTVMNKRFYATLTVDLMKASETRRGYFEEHLEKNGWERMATPDTWTASYPIGEDDPLSKKQQAANVMRKTKMQVTQELNYQGIGKYKAVLQVGITPPESFP